MGELGALFNPGMRHELEERRAKAARREEEGNARDDDLRIDLDSGVAVINTPGEDGEQPDSGSAGQSTESAEATRSAEPTTTGEAAAATESAEGAAASEPAPAPLRPRGKRAMAAGKR